MKTRRLIALLALASTNWFTGCASVNSTMNAGTSEGGLVYYMPMRDIVFTVTRANGTVTSAVPTASLSYADRSKSYMLEYQRHPLARNTLDIMVNEAGLLTSSKSNQTGDAVAALGDLGTLAGYRAASGLSIQSDVPKSSAAGDTCALDGAHTYIVPVTESSGKICDGISFTIGKLGWTTKETVSAMSQMDGNSHAGVFYRVNMPYKVTIIKDGFHSETVIFSPSESKEYFLPIARTFFANNDSKITLANGSGVPSQYVQDTDGEIAAILKLPAAIVAPYFAAVGQLLSGLSAKNTSEAAALNSSVSLELVRLKTKACIKAIQAKDTELIASLQCAGT